MAKCAYDEVAQNDDLMTGQHAAMRVRRDKVIGAQRRGLHDKISVKMVLAVAMGERVRSHFLSGAWQSA